MSLHCSIEYQAEPQQAQLKIAAALLASPDVDLVLGHHAHVVQPQERINARWWRTGWATTSPSSPIRRPTTRSYTRFTFTRGIDNHYGVTAAEAIPTRIQHSNAGIVVVPTRPGDASYGASSRCCNGATRPPRAS